MYTVRLKLHTTKYDEQIIEQRFRALAHIHNVLVKHAAKLLRKLQYHTEYQSCRKEYSEFLKKSVLSEDMKARKKELSARMSEIREEIGLTEAGLQSYIKLCGRQFRTCLSSNQVQKEATRVWHGVEKVLFADGKRLHFKKQTDVDTIGGKSNTNGVKFSKDTCSIKWLGLEIGCSLPKDRASLEYVRKALEDKISYCDIQRKMFPNGWHYYVILVLRGDAPAKERKTAAPGNVTGIDIGTSTLAAVSETSVSLEELAPRCRDYNKRIEELLLYMDRSRRATNPGKYNADGTVNRSNKDKWQYSNSYKKARLKLRSLYRQKAAYIKQSHEELANRMLEDSVDFIVEKMNFKGLQRRAKKTERSDKISVVKKKDGTEVAVRKYKRKKRFGRSLNNRAPAEFLSILERKAVLHGGSLKKVDTGKFKASQYDHSTGECRKAPLSQRFKIIDGRQVQRDLYSAFLLKNSNKALTKPNRRKCKAGFENFCKLSDDLIMHMKKNGISMKQCFGF